ncbi:MAG: hypothetical protein EZS28_021637 [Streblomastix strix]|uniref:Uncharacterized protein n=1 Tax=Streblomastix strix TaxID=222440 RepID=A0A5J4VJS3_9EUKA|nr:MAG: hypothetical protein EZS28_021637 [Streblomastix strix]
MLIVALSTLTFVSLLSADIGTISSSDLANKTIGFKRTEIGDVSQHFPCQFMHTILEYPQTIRKELFRYITNHNCVCVVLELAETQREFLACGVVVAGHMNISLEGLGQDVHTIIRNFDNDKLSALSTFEIHGGAFQLSRLSLNDQMESQEGKFNTQQHNIALIAVFSGKQH